MLVSRSEVSCRFSIQRDNRVTGAKAMSSSLLGSGPGSTLLRTNRLRSGPADCPGRAASPWDHGANAGSSETLRGPTRLSYSGAIPLRQLATACLRSPSLKFIWTSFSASAKVNGETSGPTAGAVAKAGGVPGGASEAFCGSWLHEVTAMPNRPREPLVRNSLRDFDIAHSNRSNSDSSPKRSPQEGHVGEAPYFSPGERVFNPRKTRGVSIEGFTCCRKTLVRGEAPYFSPGERVFNPRKTRGVSNGRLYMLPKNS